MRLAHAVLYAIRSPPVGRPRLACTRGGGGTRRRGMPPGPRRWADLAWPDLGAAVAPEDGHAVGLVPVGATEQHGPHLPAGTDTLVAQAICDEASARTGCLVLPALPVGVSYGHGTELPGTLCLTPELMA